jgi:hypothetical protein
MLIGLNHLIPYDAASVLQLERRPFPRQDGRTRNVSHSRE